MREGDEGSTGGGALPGRKWERSHIGVQRTVKLAVSRIVPRPSRARWWRPRRGSHRIGFLAVRWRYLDGQKERLKD